MTAVVATQPGHQLQMLRYMYRILYAYFMHAGPVSLSSRVLRSPTPEVSLILFAIWGSVADGSISGYVSMIAFAYVVQGSLHKGYHGDLSGRHRCTRKQHHAAYDAAMERTQVPASSEDTETHDAIVGARRVQRMASPWPELWDSAILH
jgi:hypothetical protein